jgi:hypothetical protein
VCREKKAQGAESEAARLGKSDVIRGAGQSGY